MWTNTVSMDPSVGHDVAPEPTQAYAGGRERRRCDSTGITHRSNRTRALIERKLQLPRGPLNRHLIVFENVARRHVWRKRGCVSRVRPKARDPMSTLRRTAPRGGDPPAADASRRPTPSGDPAISFEADRSGGHVCALQFEPCLATGAHPGRVDLLLLTIRSPVRKLEDLSHLSSSRRKEVK